MMIPSIKLNLNNLKLFFFLIFFTSIIKATPQNANIGASFDLTNTGPRQSPDTPSLPGQGQSQLPPPGNPSGDLSTGTGGQRKYCWGFCMDQRQRCKLMRQCTGDNDPCARECDQELDTCKSVCMANFTPSQYPGRGPRGGCWRERRVCMDNCQAAPFQCIDNCRDRARECRRRRGGFVAPNTKDGVCLSPVNYSKRS